MLCDDLVANTHVVVPAEVDPVDFSYRDPFKGCPLEGDEAADTGKERDPGISEVFTSFIAVPVRPRGNDGKQDTVILCPDLFKGLDCLY